MTASPSSDPALFARLEDAASVALAPRVWVEDDGWTLRADRSPARRPRSVHPRRAGADPLEAKLGRAAAFAAGQGQTLRFQMSDRAKPDGLDAELAARGFVRAPGAALCAAPVETVLARSDVARGSANLGARVSDRLDDDLAAVLTAVGMPGAVDADARRRRRAAHGVHAMHVGVLGDPRSGDTSSLGATASGAPRPKRVGTIAVGTVVIDPLRRVAGVFDVATLPDQRRRGAARRILFELAALAEQAGIRQLYLQLGDGNDAAGALYGRLGFHEVGRYHYRSAPADGD